MQPLGFPLYVAQIENACHVVIRDGAGGAVDAPYIVDGYDIGYNADEAQHKDRNQGQKFNAETRSAFDSCVLVFLSGHIVLPILLFCYGSGDLRSQSVHKFLQADVVRITRDHDIGKVRAGIPVFVAYPLQVAVL